jgi:hypothetical protein
VYSANQVNQNLSTPLPATPPSAPTSDGDIQSFKDYAAARAGTGGVQTADQQQQIAAVDASTTGLSSTNLAPAPPVLPRDPGLVVYGDNAASGVQTSVNTTPPQKMNKSDQ